jgi:hypothetical protein
MAEASVVEAFPRRALRLPHDPGRRRRRLLSLGGVLLLFLPTIWFGWKLLDDMAVRSDLRQRGVEATVLETEGECTSRRQISGDEPLGCNLEIVYEVRPEHGGGERRADVWLDGDAPRVFAPPALYDPEDPSRVMFKPEVERDLGWDNMLGPLIPAVLGVLALLLWIAGGKRGLARAGRDPRPAVVPIDRSAREGNFHQVWFRAPGREKPVLDVFPANSGPLLVRPPAGAQEDESWALALLPEKGRPFLLDRDLARYDFSADERGAIWDAAQG